MMTKQINKPRFGRKLANSETLAGQLNLGSYGLTIKQKLSYYWERMLMRMCCGVQLLEQDLANDITMRVVSECGTVGVRLEDAIEEVNGGFADIPVCVPEFIHEYERALSISAVSEIESERIIAGILADQEISLDQLKVYKHNVDRETLVQRYCGEQMISTRLCAMIVMEARSKLGRMDSSPANCRVVAHHMRKQMKKNNLNNQFIAMHVEMACGIFFLNLPCDRIVDQMCNTKIHRVLGASKRPTIC